MRLLNNLNILYWKL